MADSNITKKALATALKELLTEHSFEKITVSLICDRCQMNRKSFYYHFKDKYDLVNWIFDSEYISSISNVQTDDTWAGFLSLAEYFYDNRDYYKKLLKIDGQNCFRAHFCDCIYPVLEQRSLKMLDTDMPPQFFTYVLTDLILSAYSRWLYSKDCIPPQQFVALLKNMTEATSVAICKEMHNNK